MIFVYGAPSDIGGADTELWHVLRLWRGFGLDVTLLRLGEFTTIWRSKLAAIGVRLVEFHAVEQLPDVTGLAGSIVVSFCNGDFLAVAAYFRLVDCRLVWVNCMTWPFRAELEHYSAFGPFHAYVFQSRFQRSALFPQLRAFGVSADQCFLIPGAFVTDDFPFGLLLNF